MKSKKKIIELNKVIKRIRSFYLKIKLRLASPYGSAEFMRKDFYYLGNHLELYSYSIVHRGAIVHILLYLTD